MKKVAGDVTLGRDVSRVGPFVEIQKGEEAIVGAANPARVLRAL